MMSYPKHERLICLMKSFFASKIIDSLNNPHVLTDEDYQLLQNVQYFFESSFTARKAVNSDTLKEFPIEPDCFSNYDLILTIIKNTQDTLFEAKDNENPQISSAVATIHRDIEQVMHKIMEEVQMAIDKHWINKTQMVNTYIFFQEFKSLMIKKSINLGRSVEI